MSSRNIYERSFDEETGKTITATECPECSGTLATEGGEITCQQCGLVVNEYHLDHAAEPRSFPEDEENRKRTGAPLTQARHDRGLSTKIGRKWDAKGNSLSSKKRRQLARIRREHTRAKWQSKAERNLGLACTEIARMTSALGLERSVKEEASKLYRRAQNADLIRGRSIESMAAASLYAACRRRKQPQTIHDVSLVARCAELSVKNAYKVINTELELAVPPRHPVAFLPQFVSELGLPSWVGGEAREIAVAATEAGIGIGCNPAGVAGGCIAVVIQDSSVSTTQGELAAIADVAPVTIRKRRRELAAADLDVKSSRRIQE